MGKYIRSALCIILIAATAMSAGCIRRQCDIYSLLNRLCSLFSEEYGPSVLYSDCPADGFVLADETDIGRLYTGRYEAPSCYSRIMGFAVRLPLDDSGFEIHIIKCLNRSDADEISGLLLRRIDMICSAEIREYAPESYERYFVGAEVYIHGDLVFLLATPDNLAVKKCIRKNT